MHPQVFLAFTAPVLVLSYIFNPLEHSAGIAPYFTPHNPPLQSSPPQGCNVTGAAYLVRHAAIYANDFDYETFLEPFVQKLQNTSQNWASSKSLKFLSNWTAPISEEHVEQLTRVGLEEAQSLGVSFYDKYAHLKKPATIWSSTADRTVKSALSFISGFTNDDADSIDLTQIEESKTAGADSLTPYKGCPEYSSSYGSDQSSVSSQFGNSENLLLSWTILITDLGICQCVYAADHCPSGGRSTIFQFHPRRHHGHVRAVRVRECHSRFFAILLL